MKSNFNELFLERLQDFKASNLININDVLDDMMPDIKFSGRITKSMMARELIRNRLTSALNANEIYSCEKGNKGLFVYLKNANEDQLRHLLKKAERDKNAAATRQAKAEELIGQIKCAWDEEGHFIGFNVPEAVEL